MIFSNYRSGSSFLGETISSYPGTFYHFEPLQHLGMSTFNMTTVNEEVIQGVKDLMKCTYNSSGKPITQSHKQYIIEIFTNACAFFQHCPNTFHHSNKKYLYINKMTNCGNIAQIK